MKTMMLIFVGFLFIVGLMLMMIPLLTAQSNLINRAFTTPFECGFDPYHTSRVPFSLQFFIIALIFLIFDIEIVILLPLPLTQAVNFPSLYFLATMLFIIVLLLGTYYEWLMGALSWAN